MGRTKFKGVAGVAYENPGLSEQEAPSSGTHEHYAGEYPGKGKTGGQADLHEHLRQNGYYFSHYERNGQEFGYPDRPHLAGDSLVYRNDAGQEARMELVTPADQTWTTSEPQYNPETQTVSTSSQMVRPHDTYVLKSYPDIGAGIGVIYGQSVSPQVTPGGQTAQIPNDGTAPSAGTAPLGDTYPYPKSQWPRQDENAGAVMPKLQAQGDPHVLYGVENKPEQPAPNNSATQPGMDRTVVGDKWQPQYQTRMYIDNGQDYMNSIPGHWDLLDRALGGRGYTRNLIDDGIPPRRFINQQTGDTAEANVMENNYIVVQFYDRSGALLATTNTFSGLDGFLGQRYPYSGDPGETPAGDALYKPATQNGNIVGGDLQTGTDQGRMGLTEEEIYAIKSLIKTPQRRWQDAYDWPHTIVFDWNGTIDARGQDGGGIPWSEVQKLITAGKQVIIFTSKTDQPDKQFMRQFLREHNVKWTDDEKILDRADIFVGDKKSDMARAGKHGPKYIDVREFSADKILAKSFKLTKDEEVPPGMGPLYLTLPSGTRVELMPQHGPTGEYLYHESQPVFLPISDIAVVDPNQPVNPQDVQKEAQLAQAQGIQSMKPIVAWGDGDGRPVQLTDGHHRYAAAKQIGATQIPSLILYQTPGFQKGHWVTWPNGEHHYMPNEGEELPTKETVHEQLDRNNYDVVNETPAVTTYRHHHGAMLDVHHADGVHVTHTINKHVYDALSGQWQNPKLPGASDMLGGLNEGAPETSGAGTHEHYAGEYPNQGRRIATGAIGAGLAAIPLAYMGAQAMKPLPQMPHPTPMPVVPGGQYTQPAPSMSHTQTTPTPQTHPGVTPPPPGQEVSHQHGGKFHSHSGGDKPHKHEMEFSYGKWVPKIDILKSVSENE